MTITHQYVHKAVSMLPGPVHRQAGCFCAWAAVGVMLGGLGVAGPCRGAVNVADEHDFSTATPLVADSHAAPQRPQASLFWPEMRLSPYSFHYSRSPDHRPVWMLALNVPTNHSGAFMGASFFSNSFGQPTTYVYAGEKFLEPWGWHQTYWYWSAGLLYGYQKPYAHKVPLNLAGFSPGIVPTFGYQLTPKSAVEVNVLGFAGLMFTYVLTAP